MGKKYIYLSGPITGKTFEEANRWRQEISKKLHDDIICINPLRDNPDFEQTSCNKSKSERLDDLIHGIQTISRNRMDILKCDLIFANLKNHNGFSVGSIGEIFWADAYRKPIIMIRDESSIYCHSMLDSICQWIYDDLEEGIKKVNILLSDYQK